MPPAILAPKIFRDTDEGEKPGFFLRLERQDAHAITKTAWSYEGHPNLSSRARSDLQHPRCVFQHATRHFARYTPEMACQRIAEPTPAPSFTKCGRACRCVGSGQDRGHFVMRSVWTQHSKGVQIIPHRGNSCAFVRPITAGLGAWNFGPARSLPNSRLRPTIPNAFTTPCPATGAWPRGDGSEENKHCTISRPPNQTNRPLERLIPSTSSAFLKSL